MINRRRFLQGASGLLLPAWMSRGDAVGLITQSGPRYFAASGGGGSDPTDSINSLFKPTTMTFITWDAPRIVYPGIDVNYQFTVYDWFNRSGTWSIASGPGGSISSNGTLTYTPSSGNTSWTIRWTPSIGSYVELSFTMQADSSRCKFYSTSGNDANSGTLASPYRTLGKAMDVCQASPTGWAIFGRGGTSSTETFANKTSWWGNSSTQSNPLIVRNYPGEQPVIALGSIEGMLNYSEWNIFYGIEWSGGSGSEGACLQVFQNQVAKKCVMHGFRGSTGNNNSTGLKSSHNAIVALCDSYDNRATSPTQQQSNYLHYCDGLSSGAGAGREAFYIDNISSGSNDVGFKIKHTGADRCYYHRNVSYGSSGGALVGSDYSSVRHSLLVASNGYSSDARYAASTGNDGPEPEQDDAVLIDNNTLIAESGTNCMDLRHYFYVGSVPSLHDIWRNNIAIARGTPSASYPGSNCCIRGNAYGAHNSESWYGADFLSNVFQNNTPSQVELMALSGGDTFYDTAHVNGLYNSSGNTHGGTYSGPSSFQLAGYNWTYDTTSGLVRGSAL